LKTKKIIIDNPRNVKPGDYVTLRKQGVTVQGIHRECKSRKVHVELPQSPTGGIPTACMDHGWKFIGATREVPAVTAGDTGVGTVQGLRVNGTWCTGSEGNMHFALHDHPLGGSLIIREESVHDFVSDDKYSGISLEQGISAMRKTQAAATNTLYDEELTELMNAIVDAIKKTE
jgi:hypothetical protein